MIGFFRRNTKRIGIGLVIVMALLFSAQASAAQETVDRTLTVDRATLTTHGAFIKDLSTHSTDQSSHQTECEFDDG